MGSDCMRVLNSILIAFISKLCSQRTPALSEPHQCVLLLKSNNGILLSISNIYTACIKMIGAVLKLIIFTSMVNRITNTSRNERVTQQVYDTHLQIFDVCTLRHKAHIEALVQFLPYSAQQVKCDGLHSRGNSVLQIRCAHGLWWHKNLVLHVTPKEVKSGDCAGHVRGLHGPPI